MLWSHMGWGTARGTACSMLPSLVHIHSFSLILIAGPQEIKLLRIEGTALDGVCGARPCEPPVPRNAREHGHQTILCDLEHCIGAAVASPAVQGCRARTGALPPYTRTAHPRASIIHPTAAARKLEC